MRIRSRAGSDDGDGDGGGGGDCNGCGDRLGGGSAWASRLTMSTLLLLQT